MRAITASRISTIFSGVKAFWPGCFVFGAGDAKGITPDLSLPAVASVVGDVVESVSSDPPCPVAVPLLFFLELLDVVGLGLAVPLLEAVGVGEVEAEAVGLVQVV